jgi:hypothetical protein
MNGGCGDDGFCYFRDWLIAQGKEVFDAAVADPESLAKIDLGDEEMEAEGMAYVAGEVFAERTGEELPAKYKESLEIRGEEWKEEGDDLKRRFPKLWKKYNEGD